MTIAYNTPALETHVAARHPAMATNAARRFPRLSWLYVSRIGVAGCGGCFAVDIRGYRQPDAGGLEIGRAHV